MPMSIISSSLLVPIMDAISIIQNHPTSKGRVTHFCCSLSVFLSLVFIGPFSWLLSQVTRSVNIVHGE
ncbi:hypothetical protein BDF20DRAFT_893688 [Mycotypha africana]|uniref:uncharacterized protein n=1 Tax=Mycotypha africana TaxID=64632 RepID=UPI0023000BF2|nr:uncharacterized protein BDF20DRAFT_893688 [Mycotypha africana]KAI8969202.1 hypothetical protein BDF20DRAFT_893688 [Mycotypha africana]